MSSTKERVRLNIMQALANAKAFTEDTAITDLELEHYVEHAVPPGWVGKPIIQSLIRDKFIGLIIDQPMKLWLTAAGKTELGMEPTY